MGRWGVGKGLGALLGTTLLLAASAATAAGAPPAPGDSAAAGPANAESAASATAESAARRPPRRRVVLLGLRQRGNLARFVRRVSNPSSERYRRFATPSEFRRRFSAGRAARRPVVRFLRGRRGVMRVELNSTRTTVLAVLKPAAARRDFCARGAGVPTVGLCVPRRLRRSVDQITVGEIYELGLGGGEGGTPAPSAGAANNGTPEGCPEARATGAYTPNQIATAYGVDALHDRGLDGAGVRVATLAAQPIRNVGLGVWGRCFDLPRPTVELVRMPGGVASTAVPSNEEALDIEALASLAPRLERITPIFVPLDQSFSHSFPLFMFGALDRSRQPDGRLPHILSISDGVCESQFSADQIRLGQRLLREASALGITALAAAGDSGFLGCAGGGSGASFPVSSRFVTGLGGTDLDLEADNAIVDQTVWSTFATAGSEAVGTGGGPSGSFGRPGFQRGPGIGPDLQDGRPTRLTPDIAAMASFEPGLATYNEGQGGWGADGGTSASTPLAAAIVALVHQRERRTGRPPLGSLPPLLYALARTGEYGTIFYDVTEGTSSRRPSSPVGQTPAGGAAQPGYGLATGLGSLRATAFADAVAALP
jgi:subtilase family serine protease